MTYIASETYKYWFATHQIFAFSFYSVQCLSVTTVTLSTQLYSINLKYPDYCQKPKPDGIWKQNYEKSKTVKEEIFWIKDDILQPIWMVVWRHRTSAEGLGLVMATSQNQFKFQHLCQCNFFSASFLALTTLETPCSSVFPFYQQLCNLSHL